MIRVANGSILNSKAHVFIYVLGVGGIPIGDTTEELDEKARDVASTVSAKSRLGRLWIFPMKYEWPKTLSPTPNGQQSRTVWCALIPQQQYMNEYDVDKSLEKLASWIKSINLPLKIAAYDNGMYCSSGSPLVSGDNYRKRLEKYLSEWDVEVYHQ